jgi:hypothetical protein
MNTVTSSYVIAQIPADSAAGFACYGANRDFFYYKGEAMLSGPYETGKTITALHKLHILLSKHPRSRGLMVRKTYASLYASVVVSYEKKVLPYPPGHKKCPVIIYGGNKPEWYDYPNGSQLVLGGMDNPDKFLSAEFDFIYVNQSEELNLDDWEKLTGRATGRAGNAPYSQVFGDCNPDAPIHWILHRKPLKVFYSRHEDNPTLFNQTTGEITERGKITIDKLDALTGVRYKRGRLGIWAAATGQVYEDYDPALHLVDHFDVPSDWRRFRAIDFGYTNPFVCQWWAVDPDDRMYLYRELYRTHRLVEDMASEILRLEAGLSRDEWDAITAETPSDKLSAVRYKLANEHEPIEATITDHDAEDRATLSKHGVGSSPADKRVTPGIEAVQTRLRKAGDGKPRLFLMRDALVEVDLELENTRQPYCTEQEFPVYVYPKGQDGKPMKEEPVKMFDHGMDPMRYMTMHLERVPFVTYTLDW